MPRTNNTTNPLNNILLSLINNFASEEYELGDDAATAAKLNTPSVLVSDNALYTWAGIALIAGTDAAESLRVALESNNMGWAVHQFGGTGLQLTNPLVRGAMEQFIVAGINLQPLLDATEYYVSPAMQALNRDVLESEIADFRLTTLKDQLGSDAIILLRNKLEAYKVLLIQWDGTGNIPSLDDV